MKATIFICALLLSGPSFSQQHFQLPYGIIFGKKPSKASIIEASKVEASMGKKVRINTTIHGRVLKVTKQQGGWFEIDAGNGKVIAAHFKAANVTIPINLEGQMIIAEGVVQKQTAPDDKQHADKPGVKPGLTFEVKGLMVYK